MITITHKPTQKKAQFSAGRAAASWLELYKEKKLNLDELEIESPIHPSAYGSRVPDWAVELFESVHRDYNVTIPPIHWIPKPDKVLSTGITYDKEPRRIAISCGTNLTDAKGVVLHELAHRILPKHENHGRTFYRMAFELYRRYLSRHEEARVVAREFRYKKSSRYWYAEMYNISEILAEYYRPTYVAHRLTPEEKSQQALADMFKELDNV